LAIHTKIVCLIHLGKFDEALTSIERYNAVTSGSNEFLFEKAYTEYRLNKIDSSYETLRSISSMNAKEKELFAQVTYRLEKYDESYDTYCDVIKSTEVRIKPSQREI
jgi:hypothetical protein